MTPETYTPTNNMELAIKRIYREATPEDGYRVLVDRLWPRGVSKERAQLDMWAKGLAPSSPARTAFGHKLQNFAAFTHRYRAELETNPNTAQLIDEIITGAAQADRRRITLLYGAKDPQCNHALILCAYMVQSTPELKAASAQ